MKAKFSLQKKLIISYIVFQFFPLILIGLLIHQSYYQFFLQKEIALTTQKVNEATAYLDEYVWQINQLAVDISLSPSIQDILLYFNPNRFIGTRVETKFFQDTFGVSRLDNNKIQYLKVTTPDGQIGLSVGTTSVEPAPIDRVFSDSQNVNLWCLPRNVYSFSGKAISVVSQYQRIFSSYNENCLGMVRIDIPTSYLNKILSGYNYLSDSTLFLADQKGEIIAFHGNGIPTSVEKKLVSTDNFPSFCNDCTESKKIEDVYLTCGKALINGWRIFNVTPSAAIERQAFSIKEYVFIIGGCGAVFTLILYVLISFLITKPLRNLMQTIDKVRSDNLDARSDIRTKDEFGIISEGFNKMTSHIKELINKNVEIQRQETISELLYLQSQIEPHFLFNTLDTIRFNARREGAFEVCTQLEMLSDLFRYYLATEGKYVTFKEEFLHVEKYLSIQKLRYKERLSCSIKYDPLLDSLYTIRLILQPIVENAIIHGLEHKIENGHLDVSGIVVEDEVRITITDDGVGFDQERITRLLNEQNSSHVFALNNINTRLKLHFGNAYGIGICSHLGKGTKITLTLPVITKYPEGDY